MRLLSRLCVFFSAASLILGAAPRSHGQQSVQEWLTTADRSELLKEHTIAFSKESSDPPTITVNADKTYQTIDGFGFALTGGSAQLLHKMGASKRHTLFQQLFGHGGEAAGVSYLRVSIGASDMNEHVYTYDDMPPGKTDPELRNFNLGEDEADVVPMLREILSIAPHIQILASPWTPPSWMKTDESPKGGHLKPEYYQAYATYLVKYLQAMRAHGITITALTMQNEPENPKNTPSLVMAESEEAAFLSHNFGPALHTAGLTTKVILFDHNCDHPEYPISILGDPAAAAYADGSGFHLYLGDISAMSKVHEAFPQKNLYFTEQMVVERKPGEPLAPVAYPVSRVVIGAMRNWARNVLLWNLAADPSFGPHTGDGGCPVCQGAITIDGDNVTRNIAFYAIAHASRFVPAGSVRVDSTQSDDRLANVAWRTPLGKYVLLAANTGKEIKAIHVASGAKQFTATLGPGSVATFVW